MPNEPSLEEARGGGAPLANFLKALACANRLAKHNNISLPVMLVADHRQLRSFIKVGGRVGGGGGGGRATGVIRVRSSSAHMACAARSERGDILLHWACRAPLPLPPQAGNIANMLTADVLAVHLDRGEDNSVAEHQGTFIDLSLLARAACLVTSPSGFSHQSWLAGGGKACQRMFYACGKLEGGPGGGPDDRMMNRVHG